MHRLTTVLTRQLVMGGWMDAVGGQGHGWIATVGGRIDGWMDA